MSETRHVYVDVLQGRFPGDGEAALRAVDAWHSAVVEAELAAASALLDPNHANTRKVIQEIAAVIDRMASHRVIFPDRAMWRNAGILAGAIARLQRLSPSDRRRILNDALIFSTARKHGHTVLTQNVLGASRRLAEAGSKPAALNFANGIYPGGGFLGGARAEEEVLCRSSALYRTLANDPMYEAHRKRPRPDSTDWAMYSPDVPVFRDDDGSELEHPWLLSFITCAAPYAPAIGQPEAADLLRRRIHRVLALARAFGHAALVLGAWGCGAFGNDANRAAIDFRQVLENEFSGAFSEVVFAIADWSLERRFLGPFRDVFTP